MTNDLGLSVTPASIADPEICACGRAKHKYSNRCDDCRFQAILDAAVEVQPDSPLCLVDSDTFFGDIESAQDEYAGRWAHPCDSEPLSVNPARTAGDLVERVVEGMCEDAFEDAYSHVNSEDSLRAAFVVALTAFNDAQTANSWTPRTKEKFLIPTPETPNAD